MPDENKRYWLIDMAYDEHGNWVGKIFENGCAILDGEFLVVATTNDPEKVKARAYLL